jgi:general secretion pathway protein C
MSAAPAGFMLHRLRGWFWLVPVSTVVLCALLAALAVDALVAAELVARTRPPRPHARRAAPPPRRRDKDGTAVAARNIFCSSCETDAAPASEPRRPDDGRPPLTSLPIALVATFGSGAGVATIANARTGRAGLYAVGETIPDAGPIRRIGAQTVELWNVAAGRLERMDLVAVASAASAGTTGTTAAAAKAAPRPPGPDSELLAAADKGVTRVDERHFQVERGLLDQVLGNPMALAKQGRVLPVIEDGKAQGFRVTGVHKDSVFTKIGLQNGDVIRSINGMDLTSPDKVLDAYSRLRSSSSLAIRVARAGAPVEIEYAIR